MGGSNSRLCAQKCTQILKTVRLCCPLSGDPLISHCSPHCDPTVLHPALSSHAVTCILHCHKEQHCRKCPALAFMVGMHVRTQLPSQHHFPLHTPQLEKNCRSSPICGGRLLELLQTATVSPSPLKFVIRKPAGRKSKRCTRICARACHCYKCTHIDKIGHCSSKKWQQDTQGWSTNRLPRSL